MDERIKARRRNRSIKNKTNKVITKVDYDRERLKLRLKTIEMYNKGYVSDFYHNMCVKYGWDKISNDNNNKNKRRC